MQKSSVKTLSIIDTLSQVVREEPAKLLLDDNNKRVVTNNNNNNNNTPPQLQKRSPKVNVPSTPPFNGGRQSLTTSPIVANGNVPNGFATSSPNGVITSSSVVPPLASRKKKKKRPALVPSSHDGGHATPDWIREIFEHARRGAIDRLNASLAGLEPPLLRNLADHRGNNLVHAACARGHVNLLPLLTRKFGDELKGALVNDENSSGVTPPVLAIRLGQLDCVRWLVRNTCLKEVLLGQEGRHRTLLHHAARYGKDEVLEYLCGEIVTSTSGGAYDLVNARDGSGNSPLHLAARRGSLACASVLLRHGAAADAKNDMSMRPADCAVMSGGKRGNNDKECAEFLLLYETSYGMAKQSVESKAMLESTKQEHDELKGYFKDALSIAKRLAKERDEMCRELGRLYESMMELHNNMTMEIQVLAKENAELSKKKEVSPESKNIDACTSLHQRWQQNQRQWFSSGLIDCEHKLMMVEEGWKKARKQQQQLQQGQSDQQQPSYLQRMLRDRLEELRNRPRPVGSLQMSSSDEDDEYDSEGTTMEEYEMRRIRRNIAQRKKLDTPSPPKQQNGSGEGESIYTSLSNNDMYCRIGSSSSVAHKKQGSLPGSLGSRRTPPSPSPPTAALSSGARRRVVARSREELRQKLKEFALTSENGSASVLEVIEPTSSEEEEFKKSMREMNMTWSGMGSARYVNGDIVSKNRSMTATNSASPAPSNKSNNADEDGSGSKKNFFQKITKWKKKPAVPRKEPTGREADGDEVDDDDDVLLTRAEEHVLPDNLEDPDEEEGGHSLTISVGSGRDNFQKDLSRAGSSRSSGALTNVRRQVQQLDSMEARKSLSPQSRKSKMSTMSGAPSVATSDDSGIVLAGNNNMVRPSSRSDSNHSRPSSAAAGALRVALGGVGVGGYDRSPITTMARSGENNANSNSVNPAVPNTANENIRLGKIEEVSVASSRSSSTIPASIPQQHQHQQHHGRFHGGNNNSNAALMMTPLHLLRKKSLESKAWYDVPSDDERREAADEEEEDVSLASIISTRGGSSDDD